MKGPITTISTDLLFYLRAQYQDALQKMVLSKDYSDGINEYTEHAIPAYMIAVSIVETFVNEMLLSPTGLGFAHKVKTEGFWEALENTSLSDKLLFAPEYHFGNTFATNEQPYQDMYMLIKLRNCLVHYKMDFDIPKPVKDLQQRDIALNVPNNPWTYSISTTEGIRWAHNTVCETLKKIISFATSDNHPILAEYNNSTYFDPISILDVNKVIKQLLLHKSSIQTENAQPRKAT